MTNKEAWLYIAEKMCMHCTNYDVKTGTAICYPECIEARRTALSVLMDMKPIERSAKTFAIKGFKDWGQK